MTETSDAILAANERIKEQEKQIIEMLYMVKEGN